MPIYKTGKTGVMSGGTAKNTRAKPPKSAPGIGRKGSTGLVDFTTGVGSGKNPPVRKPGTGLTSFTPTGPSIKRATPKKANPDMPKQNGPGKRTASPPRTGRK